MYIYLIDGEYVISEFPLEGELIASGLTKFAAENMLKRLKEKQKKKKKAAPTGPAVTDRAEVLRRYLNLGIDSYERE